MINGILGFGLPGPLELMVIWLVFFCVFVITVVLIALLVIAIVHINKERQNLRTEIEKLTEEVTKLRDMQK